MSTVDEATIYWRHPATGQPNRSFHPIGDASAEALIRAEMTAGGWVEVTRYTWTRVSARWNR